jgi:hypothetical protein
VESFPDYRVLNSAGETVKPTVKVDKMAVCVNGIIARRKVAQNFEAEVMRDINGLTESSASIAGKGETE